MNSWNKYKAIKTQYEGLSNGIHPEEENTNYFNFEHEYRLTLLDFDSSEDEETENEYSHIKPIKQRKRKTILNEKHKPPTLSAEEFTKIRTFSKLDDLN